MSVEENVRIVRALLDRWLEPDAMDFLAEDFEYVFMSDQRSFPWARSYDKEEMGELLRRAAARQKDHKLVPRSITAAGETVVVEEEMTAVVGDMPVSSRSCAVFELRDGRVVQIRKYLDTAYTMAFRAEESAETMPEDRSEATDDPEREVPAVIRVPR